MKIINIKTKDLAKLFLMYGEILRKPINKKKDTDIKINIEDYDDNLDVNLEFIGNGIIEITKRDKDGDNNNSIR